MSYPGDHDRRKVNEGMWRPSRKVISAWGAWFLASPLGRLTVLAAFAIVPAVAASWGVSTPQERRIHIEAFRYGKRPAVIRCNRGDTLRLTFSARDTGHSFFLEEFDIDAKITPSRKEVAVYRVKDPTSPPQWTSEVQFEARYPGPFGWLISKSQYRCHVWCGPMHAFEHGNLIVYPNYLLWSGLGLVVGFLLLAWHDLMQNRPLPARRSLSSWNQAAGGRDIASHWLLESLLHNRCLQYLLILVCGMVFYLAVLAALGGTKVAGRNFGVIFTWVVWLFLLVMILVPLAGRVWCCVCPIPVLGPTCRHQLGGNATGEELRKESFFADVAASWVRDDLQLDCRCASGDWDPAPDAKLDSNSNRCYGIDPRFLHVFVSSCGVFKSLRSSCRCENHSC